MANLLYDQRAQVNQIIAKLRSGEPLSEDDRLDAADYLEQELEAQKNGPYAQMLGEPSREPGLFYQDQKVVPMGNLYLFRVGQFKGPVVQWSKVQSSEGECVDGTITLKRFKKYPFKYRAPDWEALSFAPVNYESHLPNVLLRVIKVFTHKDLSL